MTARRPGRGRSSTACSAAATPSVAGCGTRPHRMGRRRRDRTLVPDRRRGSRSRDARRGLARRRGHVPPARATAGVPRLCERRRGGRRTPVRFAPAHPRRVGRSRMFDERGNRSLFVKARLRPGVALPEAETAVGAVAAQLTRDRIENSDPAAQLWSWSTACVGRGTVVSVDRLTDPTRRVVDRVVLMGYPRRGLEAAARSFLQRTPPSGDIAVAVDSRAATLSGALVGRHRFPPSKGAVRAGQWPETARTASAVPMGVPYTIGAERHS